MMHSHLIMAYSTGSTAVDLRPSRL